MKDIKHIKWDFYSVPWDMPQGLGLGGGGLGGGSNIRFSERDHVAYQIKGDEQ